MNENQEVDYRPQLRDLLAELMRASWMSDADWIEAQQAMFTKTNQNYDTLNEAVLVGIRNGFSIEAQFDLFRKLFK